MQNSVKSCPFCGGKSFTFRVEEVRHLNSGCDWHHLICDGPGCCGTMSYPSESGVIEKWNTRAALSHPEGVKAVPGVGDLREALERIAALTPQAANASTARDLHLSVRAIAQTTLAALSHPEPVAQEAVDWAARINDVLEEEGQDGAACGWRSCTGCHETNEGHETGHFPFDKAFGCYVGSGCHECGGLGAVWHHISASGLAEMGRSLSDPAPSPEQGEDCPVCLGAFKAGDMCATDIELGTCHASCLEGSPIVDLETGDPVDGPIATYRYDDCTAAPAEQGEDDLVQRAATAVDVLTEDNWHTEAKVIADLAAAISTLRARVADVEARNADVQMLAFKWMERHDLLMAGKADGAPFPTPSDLPDSIARAERAEAEKGDLQCQLERAREVIKPFADRCDEAIRLDDSDTMGITVKALHLRAARAFEETSR